jgi:hypothetical protein
MTTKTWCVVLKETQLNYQDGKIALKSVWKIAKYLEIKISSKLIDCVAYVNDIQHE